MRAAFRWSLLLACLSVAAVLPAHADLLNNGGFETGDFTGWDTSNLNNTNVQASGFDGYPSHSGNFFAALGNLGSQGIISQTFSDTAGQQYDFSFYLASNGSANTFAASINGTDVLGPTDIGAQGYTLYSFTFTGTGSDTISFSERDDPDWIALDDASVLPSTVSAVPEPSSLVLMATGLAGFAGTLRRRMRLN